MTTEQAFYLLKHFNVIDADAVKLFLTHGFKEEEINGQLQTIGSKFLDSFCQNPFDLITLLKKGRPIEQIIQSNARIATVYEFEELIGTEQVIAMANINPVDIIQMDRNGRTINAVQLKALPSTNQLVVVKTLDDIWITAFPGNYAPAFPSDWMNHTEKISSSLFWENHLFVSLSNK